MSVTASRSVVLACILAVTLVVTVSPATAQDGEPESEARASSTELVRSSEATASQRTRRAWVPPLRLRTIALMSELTDPAEGGPAMTDPRWFAHRHDASPSGYRLTVWLDRLVVPRALPCADDEPSGEIDCRTPTTLVAVEVP